MTDIQSNNLAEIRERMTQIRRYALDVEDYLQGLSAAAACLAFHVEGMLGFLDQTHNDREQDSEKTS